MINNKKKSGNFPPKVERLGGLPAVIKKTKINFQKNQFDTILDLLVRQTHDVGLGF